jgi:hypothetical protein
MPEVLLSKLTLPVNVEGTVSNVEFTLKDAYARERLTELGSALYWIGVTTTELVDDVTTSASITVGGESVTAEVGGMAQYDGEEFVYNGTKWQAIGKANFGALAFKSSAEGSYTPAGTITVTKSADTTDTIAPFGTAGTLPSASWIQSGENVSFVFDAGTLPTAGTDVTVVTESGANTAAFTGTAATITVE